MSVTRRRGAHRSRSNGPTVMTMVLGGAVAVALAAGSVWAYDVVRSRDEAPAAPQAGDTHPTFTCPSTPLKVTATPAIADVVKSRLTALGEANGCGDAFAVRAQDPATALAAINAKNAPDVWIPDARSWADQVDARSARSTWLDVTSVASSPVVLASRAKSTPKAPESWRAVLTGGDVRVARLEIDAASRTAYLAARNGVDKFDEATGAKLIGLAQTLSKSTDALVAQRDHPFPTTEQQVLASKGALRMTAPKAGTLPLEYRWTISPKLAGDRLAVADAALATLRDDEGKRALVKAGFRVDDATPTGALPVRLLRRPTSTVQATAMQQWAGLATPLRLLAVFDVSGSMKSPVSPGGPSRAEVASTAAGRAVGAMPPANMLGTWVFSSRSGPIRAEYREVVPIRPLGAKVGKVTQRQVVGKAITNVGDYLGGDTALYDTTWAAYEKMRRTYDDGAINAVVIITDGKDDNPGDGDLSLTQLVTRLRTTFDPQRPVSVVTIGLGESDPAALQAISLATSTQSYDVKDPSQIGKVLVDALSSWKD